MNTLKKIITILIIFGISLSLTNAFAQNVTPKMTIESYDQWLCDKIDSSSSDMKNEITNDLLKFRSLSKDKQQKLVNLLNDPIAMKNCIEKELKNNSTHSINHLNVVPSKTICEKDYMPANEGSGGEGEIVTKQVKGVITYKDSGIDMFKIAARVRFRHKDFEIIGEPVSGNIQVIKNLSPALTYDTSLTSLFTDGSSACAEADITIGIGVDDIDIEINGINIVFKADPYGNSEFETENW